MDLLDVSRMEAGRFSVEPGPESLRSIIAEARELFTAVAAGKSIELVSHPLDEDVIVHADRGRLLQVMSNLIGNAIFADGVGTAVATSVGGSPTTTYAENIGVMAATRIYSTAAYYVAGVVAIAFGLIPKFGALVAATPGGVLGGITVVLYGMIGLLGAKIWIENRVDFANPINLVPIGAGIILAVGPVGHQISDDFTLEGIALGTIVLLAGYHLLRWLAPEHMRATLDSPAGYEGGTGMALGDAGRHEASLGEVGFERGAAGDPPGTDPTRGTDEDGDGRH
jgi:hypothetical protein